jgi:uncharacterized protein
MALLAFLHLASWRPGGDSDRKLFDEKPGATVRWRSNMEYCQPNVRVGPSRNGLGVFAVRSFAVREIVGPIRGDIFDDAEYESDYCMEIGDGAALEPAPPFRYLNHSCHPNCSLVEFETEFASHGSDCELWLKVEQNIGPGEELTIDYAWPAWTAIPCRCGSADCRKWIVAADEVDSVALKNPCPDVR